MLLPTLTARMLLIGPPAHELQVVGDHLQAGPRLALLVGPRSGLQSTIDVDFGALAQVLGEPFRLLAEEGRPHPLGPVLPLAFGTPSAIVAGDVHLQERLAARRVAQLRIRTEVADHAGLEHGCCSFGLISAISSASPPHGAAPARPAWP